MNAAPNVWLTPSQILPIPDESNAGIASLKLGNTPPNTNPTTAVDTIEIINAKRLPIECKITTKNIPNTPNNTGALNAPNLT